MDFLLGSPMLINIELARFLSPSLTLAQKNVAVKNSTKHARRTKGTKLKSFERILPCFIIHSEAFLKIKNLKVKNFSGIFSRRKKQTCMWKIYETKIDEKFIMKTWGNWIRFLCRRGGVEMANETKRNIHFSKAWLAKHCWNQEEMNDCKQRLRGSIWGIYINVDGSACRPDKQFLLALNGTRLDNQNLFCNIS